MLTWTHQIADGGLLHFDPQFVEEHDALFQAVRSRTNWEQGKNRWGMEPRLSAWYADSEKIVYHYSGLTRTPQPWPACLLSLRDRLNHLCGTAFNSCLANLYRDGRDSMGYHADDEPELGENPTIASVSLGAVRVFLLRGNSGAGTMRFELGPGSLLVMAGTTQSHWKHAIPKTKKVVRERINLTFREIHAGTA